MNSIPYQEYLAFCQATAREAGKLLMGYFTIAYETRQKKDESPVTDADVAANTHIVAALKSLTPHIPVIAEEDESLGAAGQQLFWLVDPLDGTRSFVRGEAEFTVNIALVQNRQPILGVLHSPPHDVNYYAALGQGAFRQRGDKTPERIHTRTPAKDGLVVVRSRSHPSAKSQAYLEKLPAKEVIPCSSAIKFCQVAEGSADIYPRFGRTMEWDTAAGHIIVTEAGGRIETVDGQPLVYGKAGFENPGFIAYGK